MTENKYQAHLIRRITMMFPGCMVMKTDTQYQQGMPDLVILYKEYWASLEVKASESAPEQPNQRHFIEKLGDMSFAAFIYPEIEEEVLSALQQAFEPPRGTRISES